MGEKGLRVGRAFSGQQTKASLRQEIDSLCTRVMDTEEEMAEHTDLDVITRCDNLSTACMANEALFDAVRLGDARQVERLLRTCDISLANVRDEYGHTAAHWMALHGHLGVAKVLAMSQTKSVLDLHSENSQGPRPIHWAARSGHVAIVNALINMGVSVDATDRKGLTPLMMACMFGRSWTAAFLLGMAASPDLRDANGDTALHWAAYKGFPSLMQMLINAGCQPMQADHFGSAPLHLACISGNLLAVKMLCAKSSVELEPLDRNHKTPLDLAVKHGHEAVVRFLQSEQQRRSSFLPVFLDIWSLVFGRTGRSRGPLIFFLCSVCLWCYPMYILRCVPSTWSALPWTHYTFLVSNLTMWLSLVVAHFRDPGFLPVDCERYHRVIRQLAYYDEWKSSSDVPDVLRLCHTCRVLRPQGTRHCRICDRCVHNFDHHCPYILNCVGLRNRVWFVLFTLSVALNCGLVLFFALYSVLTEGFSLMNTLALVEAFVFCGLGAILAGFALLYAAMKLSSSTSDSLLAPKRHYAKRSLSAQQSGNSHVRRADGVDQSRVARRHHLTEAQSTLEVKHCLMEGERGLSDHMINYLRPV